MKANGLPLRASAHWKPVATPTALKVNFADRFAELIVAVASFVSGGASLNVAVTLLSALSVVSGHVPVPEQPPDQPANVDPAAATAVRVTEDPAAKWAEHVAPQLIPAGLEVTVPDPAPSFETVTFLVTVTLTVELSARPVALVATTAYEKAANPVAGRGS